MKKRYVVLEFSTGRADLARFEGTKRIDQKRIAWTHADTASEWISDVRHAAPKLREAVTAIGGTGLPVVVLYRSPSVTIDLASVGVRSEAQAVDAARLSCIDALTFTDAVPIVEACVVARDQGGDDRQTHTVVAGDRDDLVQAIVQVVTEAGLEFESATPTDAAIFARLVRESQAEKSDAAGVLYIGDESSFFICSGAQQVYIARSMGLGFESLITTLKRPIRVSADTTVELTPDEARTMVFQHGIPAFDATIQHTTPLAGRQIIPLLQPILQRLVVEVRQSVRFGLPSSVSTRVPIRLCGPGARVPGLATILQRELELDVTVDPRSEQFDPELPASRGSTLIDAMGAMDVIREINLQPELLATTRRSVLLRRWLWLGGAAAVILLAFETILCEMSLRQIRDQVSSIEQYSEDIAAFVETRDALAGGLSAMTRIHEAIDAELGQRPAYGFIMKELSLQAGDDVSFTSIRVNDDGRKTTAKLSGYCREPVDADPSADRRTLEIFVDRMRSSSLFENVKLGSVQAGSFGQSVAQRFEISFEVVRVPTGMLNTMSADADGNDGEIAP
ncbi:MAG: hypothetical protein KC983_00900 [Phycisphaerales bacterium]|nr:hypothetical protein [Phycisphaerales bacterium]